MVILTVVLLLLISAILVAPRWLLYPAESQASKYPGSSQVAYELGRQFLVDPRWGGEPFFVSVEESARYSADYYNLLEIPPQKKLFYAAGRVVRWEETESGDKLYLILKHESGEKRYRVTGETVVVVERVGMPWKKEPNKLEKLKEGKVEQMTISKLKRMVLPGDAVVVLPVWELPELSKKDEEGEYLVFNLVIRRWRGL